MLSALTYRRKGTSTFESRHSSGTLIVFLAVRRRTNLALTHTPHASFCHTTLADTVLASLKSFRLSPYGPAARPCYKRTTGRHSLEIWAEGSGIHGSCVTERRCPCAFTAVISKAKLAAVAAQFFFGQDEWPGLMVRATKGGGSQGLRGGDDDTCHKTTTTVAAARLETRQTLSTSQESDAVRH